MDPRRENFLFLTIYANRIFRESFSSYIPTELIWKIFWKEKAKKIWIKFIN